MNNHAAKHLDFGFGDKKLSIYSIGMAICVLLTIISFHAVMSEMFTRLHTIAIIFTSAVVQFLVQVIFFLRLNVDTEQSIINVFSFIYTILILLCIVAGSLWIMVSTNYYMMH